MGDKHLEQISKDLEAIKKLLVFKLISEGHSQSKVAAAIGVSQASISRMFAKGRDDKKE